MTVNSVRRSGVAAAWWYSTALCWRVSAMTDTSTSHTPILDRVSPIPPRRQARRRPGSRIVRVTAIILAGALFSVLANMEQLSYIPGASHSLRVEFVQAFLASAATAVFFLVPLAGLMASTAIHEAGHLVAGLCAGLRFNSLRVYRLQFDLPFRFSIYRGMDTGAAGWTSMFPCGSDRLAQRALVMVIGGPAANLLTGILVFCLPFPKGYFLFWLGTSSLLAGAINLIPFRRRGFLSDGWRILTLLQNRESAERWLSLLKLGVEWRKGVPPESISEEFLRKTLVLRDNTPDTVAAYAYAYSLALARHDNARAAQCLEVCLQYSPYASPPVQEALMSEAGVFQARKRKRVDLAEHWMAALPAKLQIPWLRTRVEAAILEAKGDAQGAVRKLDEAEKMILATPNQAMRETEHRALLRWKSELQPGFRRPEPVANSQSDLCG